MHNQILNFCMALSSTCFIIDDDSDDQEIFASAIKKIKKTYRCITANNCSDALKKLKNDESFTPDYIFLDLNMPRLSGKACLEEIKKIPRLKNVPIIIYTTSSYQKDIEETKKLGASHYLIKPSNTNYLTKILAGLFQNQNLSFSLNAEMK